jgi:catechol-2,3-dioxygenase
LNIISLMLETAELPEMKNFYINQLGFRMMEETESFFCFEVGTTAVTFQQAKRGTMPVYHFAMNIPENQICDAKILLDDKVKIVQYVEDSIICFKSWNAHSIYFNDPAGNIVELIARHGLNNPSTINFDMQHCICVSEIGIAVTDVLSTLTQLEDNFQETAWRTPSETFAPVGDEQGLIILVRTGREWFMSDITAYPHPVSVCIGGKRDFSIMLDHKQGVMISSTDTPTGLKA